jgi:hypothetical protein
MESSCGLLVIATKEIGKLAINTVMVFTYGKMGIVMKV